MHFIENTFVILFNIILMDSFWSWFFWYFCVVYFLSTLWSGKEKEERSEEKNQYPSNNITLWYNFLVSFIKNNFPR